MASTFCKNCGAGMDLTMRFCRRCGQQVDESEATTRTLEEPARAEAATRITNSGFTSPTYEPAAYLAPQPTPHTKELEESRHKKNVLILAGAVGLLLIAVIVLTIALLNQSPRTIIVKPPPEVPAPPSMPPPPPPPPLPGARGGAPAISESLVYPGSERVVDVTSPGGRVTQFMTDAPVDKVVEWYTAKMNPANVVRTPGNTVLKKEGIVVAISGQGPQTHIIIKQGEVD